MTPIVEAIGLDMAIQLAAACGGTRVMVRETPQSSDRIGQAIGLDAARLLAASLGQGLLEVPRCTAWLVARRNEELVARSLGGETQASLATRFALTERHVRRILAEDGQTSGLVPICAEEGATA